MRNVPSVAPDPLTTNDIIIRTVLGLLAFAFVTYVLALFVGKTVIPPAVLEGLTPYILPLLISAVGAMTYALNQRQQKKVEGLIGEVRDGLGTKIAASVNATNEQIAATLEAKREADAKALALIVDQATHAALASKLISDARVEASRILDAANADAQRLKLAQQVAAIPGMVAAIPNITNPLAAPSTVESGSGVGEAIREAATAFREETKDNTAAVTDATAATQENTSATITDTAARVTALEDAAKPPKETP